MGWGRLRPGVRRAGSLPRTGAGPRVPSARTSSAGPSSPKVSHTSSARSASYQGPRTEGALSRPTGVRDAAPPRGRAGVRPAPGGWGGRPDLPTHAPAQSLDSSSAPARAHLGAANAPRVPVRGAPARGLTEKGGQGPDRLELGPWRGARVAAFKAGGWGPGHVTLPGPRLGRGLCAPRPARAPVRSRSGEAAVANPGRAAHMTSAHATTASRPALARERGRPPGGRPEGLRGPAGWAWGGESGAGGSGWVASLGRTTWAPGPRPNVTHG